MAAENPAAIERRMYVDMHLGGVDDPALSIAELRYMGGGGVNASRSASSSGTAALGSKVDKGSLVVNVKEYGATGDGMTDDTAAIVAADAAAAARGAGLFFPPGTYMAGNLAATSSWAGATRTLTTIKRNANGDLITAAADRSIISMTIDGNGGAFTGRCVLINGTPNVTISDCNILGATAHAVNFRNGAHSGKVLHCRVEGDVYVTDSNLALIDGCQFYAGAHAPPAQYGVGVAALIPGAGTADGARIVNNYFEISTMAFGVSPMMRNAAKRPVGTVIANNVFKAVGTCYGGISVDMCDVTTISGNAFISAGADCTIAHLEVVSSNRTAVTGNSFDGGNAVACLVSIDSSSDNTFVGNVLSNPAAAPEMLDSTLVVQAQTAGAHADRNVIANNVFGSGSTCRGIYVVSKNIGASANGTIVTGNTFNGPVRAVQLLGGQSGADLLTGTTIRGNTVSGGATHLVYLGGDSGTLIAGNTDLGATTRIAVAGAGTTAPRAEGNSWQNAPAAPTTQYHVINEVCTNSAPPVEAGTVGSKYVVTGWVCTAAGTPGMWLPMRSLTGN